uniref:CSON006919 protein n=1 Tax=Culicoides sonorensis TaxID=179676 RepID=A0A336MVM8_CULSO
MIISKVGNFPKSHSFQKGRYQQELPKRIKQRGKDAHMVHEELVQTMKWKQTRGKFYPQLSYLIKVNTPRAVMVETKRAFKKLPNLEQAIAALSNLKGVGTTMASALLAAASPENAPFMADECIMAIPEIEGIDYTTKEYLNYCTHIQSTVDRLNAEKDSNASWSAHRVELAVWTHYVASDLKPEWLEGLSELGNGVAPGITVAAPADTTNDDASNDVDTVTTTTTTLNKTNGVPPSSIEASDESNLEPATQPAAQNGNGKFIL